MRTNLLNAVALCIFAITCTSSNAETITEYTNGSTDAHGNTISAPASSLGFQLNLAGLTTIIVPNVAIVPGSFLVVDHSLDSNNSGFVSVIGGSMKLQDFSTFLQFGLLGGGPVTGTGIEFSISTVSPVAASNGAFAINSSSPGYLIIDSGTLNISGILLGGAIDYTFDFASDPLVFPFADLLGANSLPGYVIKNSTDAAFGIGYGGLAATRTIDLLGIGFPTTITLVGNSNVAAIVPEVSSIVMIGVFATGVLGIARNRR